MKSANRIWGVFPVVAVPFSADQEVDFDGFRTIVAKQVEAGAHGVMFPGFASEFHKLTRDERRRLTAELIEELTSHGTDRAAPVAVISITDHATAIAVREARHAVDAGADALNLLPPFLFGPSSEAVERHIRSVVAAVSPVPVLLQHAPAQTGGALATSSLVKIAADHPNLRTVKVESQPPGPLVSALLEATPSIGSFVGYAGLHAVDALERGAIGIMPGCSFTELYVEFFRRWDEDDRPGARVLHRQMLPYLSAWMQHVEIIVAVEKTIAYERGWFKSSTVRTPGWDLDRYERRRIDAFLEEFASWLTP